MLESQQAQLVMGLQELYRRSQTGEGWLGAPLKDAGNGAPLTHDILERLGALKPEGHSSPDAFEEDLQAMQQRLVATGAGFAPHQRDSSPDTSSELAQSPVFESMPYQRTPPLLSADFFAPTRFPPTPPHHSPLTPTSRTASSSSSRNRQPSYTSDMRTSISSRASTMMTTTAATATATPMTATRHASLGWTPITTNGFDDAADYYTKFESPLMPLNPLVPAHLFDSQLAMGTLNPCLPMKDWNEVEDDDFQSLFNPTLI